MNVTFTFLESSETSPESLPKMQLWGPKHHTKCVDQRKLTQYTNLLLSNNLTGHRPEY